MTTNRRALTALSLLLLASLGLAACGGGDDTNASTSTSTSAEPLTKSELAATADQLCTEMSQRVSDRAEIPDFGKDGLQSDELEAAYPFFAARAEEGQALVDELDGLKPPQAIAAPAPETPAPETPAPETPAPEPLESEAASIGAQLSELDEVLAAIEMATQTLERTYAEEIQGPDRPGEDDADTDSDAAEPAAG